MLRMIACSGPALAIVLSASTASAIGLRVPNPADGSGRMVSRVHSVDEAEDSLRRRGYYDVRLERSSLPYSFNACRRGTRYHIHVNYYGDLVQVDPIGPCGANGYGYYFDRRPNYDDRYNGRYYDRYRYRPRYYE
jgi:hypothetical protein